ncbi:MAG: TRAP transporter substrate-binding protein [Lachnospiraceae bacterium]|nr:TRAP transporter substrate-binding protein [Lachnospiraceae bacterium]
MRRSLSILLCAAMIGCTLGACGGIPKNEPDAIRTDSVSDTPESQDVREDREPGGVVLMRIGHAQTEQSPRHRSLLSFQKNVQERTNGGIVVEIYPNGQLGDETSMTVDVSNGLLEAVRGGDLEFLPETGALSLPMLADTIEEARELCYSDYVSEMLSTVEINHNMKVLAVGDDSGFRQFTNSVREIRKPEDMKGLRFRVPPLQVIDTAVTAFGATTVTIPFTELYAGLLDSSVDGQENPLALIDSSHFYEVQKYCTIIDYMFCVELMYVNLDWWNSLSGEYQTILTDAARQMMDECAEITDEENAGYIRHISGNGCKVTRLSRAERQAFLPFAKTAWQNYIDEGRMTKQELEKLLSVIGKSVE